MSPMARQADRRLTNSPEPSQETRAADFMTVGWLLAAMTTLVCTAIAVVLVPVLRLWPDQAGLRVLSGFLLFAGTVIGLASVALLVVVLKVRVEPPPRSLVVGSVAVALVSPALLVLRMAGIL